MRDGDDYVINGQKMWTSLIAYADYVWLAVRTNPEAKKHRGISMLIVPTDGRRLLVDAGAHDVGCRHQRHLLPGRPRPDHPAWSARRTAGWKLVTNQLNHERVALVSAQPIFSALDGVREWAQNTKDAHGKQVDRLGVGAAQPRAGARQGRGAQAHQLGTRLHRGAAPSPADASAAKVYGTELATEAYRLLMEVLGTAATLRTDTPGALLRGRVERMHRSCLILTFGGGTNEIQRDIIGMVALGLPRVNR